MAATKRPVDSGRTDSRGHVIKVSEQTVAGRATAPPPPDIAAAGDKDDTGLADAVPDRPEHELAAEELAAATAALAAARTAVLAAEKAVMAAKNRVARANEPQLRAAVKEIVDRMEAAYSAYEATRSGSSLDSVEAHAPRLAAAEAAVETFRNAHQVVNDFDLASRTEGSKEWDWKHDPLHGRYYKLQDAMFEARGREYDIGGYLRLEAGGRNMRSAINHVDLHGPGDGSGLPCTNCGGPRNRFNDESYSCGSCN